MKVLIINDFDLNELGGGEIHIGQLIHLLESKGHQVVYMSGENNGKSIKSFYNASFKKKIEEHLTKNHYDVVHVHSISRNISASFLSCFKKYNILVVMTIHAFIYNCPKSYCITNGNTCLNKDVVTCLGTRCMSHSNYTGVKKQLEDAYKVLKINFHKHQIKKYVDILICPSQELFKQTKKIFPNKRVELIPNFVDITNINRHNYKQHNKGIKRNTKKFLYVGRLSVEKGVDILLHAIHYIVYNFGITDLQVEIVGDGPDAERLKSMSYQMGLASQIQFLGKVSHGILDQYYFSSAALIIPSIWLEAFGLVNIEAMKFHTPIIGAKIGGIPDLVEDGKNGYLFERGNYIELSKKILLLYGNINKIHEFGRFGFVKLLQNFSHHMYYNKIIGLYIK